MYQISPDHVCIDSCNGYDLCWLLYHYVFFFNDTATTEIYTLSLHDALPISLGGVGDPLDVPLRLAAGRGELRPAHALGLEVAQDRKSTRLNSSHLVISYAVFCLKKKKKT